MTDSRNKIITQTAQATDDILADYMDQLLLRTVVTDEVNEGALIVDGEIQGWEPEVAEHQPLNEILTQPVTEPVELTEDPQSLSENTSVVSIQPVPLSSPTERDIQDEPAFDCLIIRAGEFRLGIPTTALGTIHTADRKPTPVPGQVPWILGSWPHDGRTLQVIDCLKLVMPERQTPMDIEETGFYLQLGDSIWLLACDEVFEPVHTEHTDVRWRANRKDRPWMAGIHKTEMCVVLDVAGLLGLTGSGAGI